MFSSKAFQTRPVSAPARDCSARQQTKAAACALERRWEPAQAALAARRQSSPCCGLIARHNLHVLIRLDRAHDRRSIGNAELLCQMGLRSRGVANSRECVVCGPGLRRLLRQCEAPAQVGVRNAVLLLTVPSPPVKPRPHTRGDNVVDGRNGHHHREYTDEQTTAGARRYDRRGELG